MAAIADASRSVARLMRPSSSLDLQPSSARRWLELKARRAPHSDLPSAVQRACQRAAAEPGRRLVVEDLHPAVAHTQASGGMQGDGARQQAVLLLVDARQE